MSKNYEFTSIKSSSSKNTKTWSNILSLCLKLIFIKVEFSFVTKLLVPKVIQNSICLAPHVKKIIESLPFESCLKTQGAHPTF